MKSARSGGLSLKQMLVTLAIIAILLGLLFPIASIWRYKALEARCRSNLWAILIKYQMMKQSRKSQFDWYEFKRWLHFSPESASIRFCPLGGVYRVAYEYDLSRNYAGPPQYRPASDLLDKQIVVFCFCHTKPIKPGGCSTPVAFNFVKFLAACDEGDGKVEYRFLYPSQSFEVEKFVPTE